VEAVQVFSEQFASYPRPTLVAVQGDFVPSMEYDGLFFVGHTFYHYVSGDPRDYLIVMTVHETAHQWWFGLVGNDQAREPWLDESLATYSEQVFYEMVYPDSVDWWQEIRLSRHEPLAGWVDTTIYDFNRQYVDTVYLRGAAFLEDLRGCIGDVTFFAFFHDYAATYAHRRSTTGDFFVLLRQHTDADISGIIATYFSHNY
jgi:aminopeptidase N